MITLFELWLPILLSAVAVFVSSSIIHMVLQYHKTDFDGLPDESKVMDALRGFRITPGNYNFPHAHGMKEYGSPWPPAANILLSPASQAWSPSAATAWL